MRFAGNIIRENREAKGFLLRELAAKIPIDQALLSKIERGERKPTRNQILRIAEELEIDQDQILIEYMSDKIVLEICEEKVAVEILKIAAQKLAYIRKQK